MRVRYLGPPDGPPNPLDGRYHFTPGQEYCVLELHVARDGTSSFRIEYSPRELAGLYWASCFEQISDRIPSRWNLELHQPGGLSLGPPEWSSEDFWERMMERDPEAESCFEVIRDEILAEDSGA